MKKRVMRGIAVVCIAAMMLCLAPAAFARDLAEVKSEIDEKKEYLDTLAANIEANKNNKAAAEASLAEFEAEYNKLVVLIEEQRVLIEKRAADLDFKGEQLSLTLEEISQSKAELGTRLQAMYEMNSNQVMLATLLQVDDFTAYAVLADSMSRVSKRDTEMLEALDKKQADYEVQKQDLEATLETLRAEMENHKANLADCEARMQQMKDKIGAANMAIAQGQQEVEHTEEEVAELQAEYNKIFAELQKKSSQKGDGSIRYDGPLAWPVPGASRISSYFDDPRSNTGTHYGIDIPAGTGTSIIAAAPGTVVISTWHYSYGNYIVIDHGDGLRTLYAHCHSLYVSTGTYVAKGDTIAGVGNTGNSYGAHLHFEVHDGGVRKNPLNAGYLS